MFPLLQSVGASSDCHNFSNVMDSGRSTQKSVLNKHKGAKALTKMNMMKKWKHKSKTE